MGKYDGKILDDFWRWLNYQLRLDEYGEDSIVGPPSHWWHRPGLRASYQKLETLVDDYKIREHMEQRSADHIEAIAQRAAEIVLQELKKEG